MYPNVPSKRKRKLLPLAAPERPKNPNLHAAEVPRRSDVRVRTLKEAKNTPENRSFSDLDYNLMTELFKGRGRAMLEAAKALCASPPAVSEFDFSESPSHSLKILEPLKSTTPPPSYDPNSDRNNINIATPVAQDLTLLSCEISDYTMETTHVSPINTTPVSHLTPFKQNDEIEPVFCVGSPSILSQNVLTFSMEDLTVGLHVADILTDCETPTKEPQTINRSSSEIQIGNGITDSHNAISLIIPSSSLSTSENNIATADLVASHSKKGFQKEDLLESGSEVDDSDADPDYPIRPADNYGINNSESDDSLPSSTESEEIIAPKTRKNKADPSKWKRNRTKTLRNAGKEYSTLKKGNLVTSRKMGPPCHDRCRLKCYSKFSNEDREAYFESYWSLKDINKQRQYILNAMEMVDPTYRYPVKKANQTPRQHNHAFFFHKSDQKERVCKSFFISTLGITNRCIRTVVSKTKNGFLSDDMRGKHQHHVTVPEEVKRGARAHIASIPTVESHYTRADSSKNYIEGGRTLIDLYTDYKQECQTAEKEFVSLSLYRQIFNYEFNMEFFKPKKDLCQFCETYKNMNNDEKLEKEIDYMRHHEEKNLSRDEKALDKSKINKNYKVACFDLQAALPTPRGEVSTFYYKSKLSTYDFTICDLDKKGLGTVNCYVWHEGEGHKGSSEIGSCVLNYLELCASSSNIGSTTEVSEDVDVVFYSDNCGGQGKNKFIIAAYLYAVSNFNIKSITHKFLVVGHTQNEGDVAHSLIEKNIKKALKSSPIYVPSQYTTLISTARKSGEPFKIHELDHEFFLDLKELVDVTATNFNINCEGQKFNFNDICVIKVEKEYPGTYFYKTSYKDNSFKSVNVSRCRTRKQLTPFNGVQLKKAYSESIAISERKYQDLMSLIKSKTIPHCHAAFYESLKH